MVLIHSDLNKVQIYKMPYRDSPNHQIEIITNFNHLNLFETIEHIEDYHIRKPNHESFLI